MDSTGLIQIPGYNMLMLRAPDRLKRRERSKGMHPETLALPSDQRSQNKVSLGPRTLYSIFPYLPLILYIEFIGCKHISPVRAVCLYRESSAPHMPGS